MSDSNKFRNPNDENLTLRDHMDPDKHWIGETLPAPTQGELAGTVGTTSGPGDSPFPARADHYHKLDGGYLVQLVNVGGLAAPDITTTPWVDWITSSQVVNIPSWAIYGYFQVNIGNIWMATAASTGYGFEVNIDGAYTSGTDRTLFTPVAISERHHISFAAIRAISPAIQGTARNVTIGARRYTGTGVLKYDSSCRASILAWFK